MTRKTTTFFVIFSLSLLVLAQVGAQQQSEYVLLLQGPTWNHSVITILVTPQYDAPWWNLGYLNSTLRAIDQWNEGLSYFASNYSEFAYLSQVMLVPEVANSTNGSFDAYISWVERFNGQSCEAGLTQTTYDYLNTISNSTITFSAYDCRGDVLSEVDMQNVAIHELGHCLGLGHANYTGDLMYFAYTLGSPVRAVSTLDAYGVGTVFRWMAYSQEFSSDNQGAPIYSVTLPSNIPFQYLPISAKNRPPSSAIEQVVTFLNELAQVVSQPEAVVLVLLAVGTVAAYVTTTRVRRKCVYSE